MKSTIYITEITTQKYEKNLPEGRKLGPIYLLACLLCVNKGIFCVSLLKNFLPFLTNQAAQFISHGIYWSLLYFREYSSIIHFDALWYDFKILAKSREGVHFCQALSVINIWKK